ncbi:MAG: DUF3313 domain-containing protein [Rubrivivax sp.]|jgi:hypothetical protein|nr:DUF3313 domain-containing protein [Betaproteobacteria bacterium]MBP6317181.1 DUF3313 domain-containing protein [Rubrivivax sp.]MBK7457723.1 DUF3313 domain-containing protein [Betaproteobacteria bacterium]MBK7514070.1 DUF3313 domain-containing protein [Betaproteobacteria bacterium]MBK8105704.1 DUF3313 domain-containing protein [Betaproteobacteria bacterium]
MEVTRRLGLATLLISALVASGAFAAKPSGLDEAMSHDGLQKVKVKGIQFAYARPGATLAGYDRVQIEPVQVAFHKHWDPTRTGSRIKLGQEERENIRNGVASAVQEAFATELQERSRYKVVDEAGPDVLRVKVAIVDLYVNAPDTESVAMSRTYTISAGRMTLFAELFDSESGQLLARVIDKREGRDDQMYRLSNSVVQRGELQDIASTWARILRRALDNAHGIGTK